MRDYKVAFLLPTYFGSNHSMFLGVGYLVSAVKRKSNDAIVIDEDAISWLYHHYYKTTIDNIRKRVIHEINKYSPDMLCFMINTANYKNALRLLSYVREEFPQIFTVVGGPHISTCYEEFSRLHSDLYDAAIIGEGEETLCQLIDSIKRGINNKIIPGACYSGDVRLVSKRALLDVDSINPPDRNAFFVIFEEKEKCIVEEHYKRVFYSKLPGFENGHARVVASRGCYNQCTFCSPGVYWRNPLNNLPCRRVRSAKKLVDEIEKLLLKGIYAIYFDDPTFPIKSDIAFFNLFENEILSRGLKFHWGAPICSNEIDSNILDRLQRLGFTYTYFGLENYREENLNDFRKQQDISMCLKIINECRVRGIHCDASYQIGLPNESIDDIKRSIDWIFKHGIERNTFYSITAIWPGTELAKKYGVIADYYEPSYDKKDFEARSGLFFYEQGNPVIEQFYSNCSGTYHFIPVDLAIEVKYYMFDNGLTNRFIKK